MDLPARPSRSDRIPAAGRACTFRLPAGKHHPARIRPATGHPPAGSQHPGNPVDALWAGPPHRLGLADGCGHRYAAADSGVVRHRYGVEHVPAEHRGRRGHDADRCGNAALHRYRRHRQERIRIGPADRGGLGNQRWGFRNARRRRAQPANRPVPGNTTDRSRVSVHHVGDAADAADDPDHSRLVDLHAVRFQNPRWIGWTEHANTFRRNSARSER